MDTNMYLFIKREEAPGKRQIHQQINRLEYFYFEKTS